MNRVDGLLAYYGLQEWWFSSFSDNEREYIDNRYQPMGFQLHSLTKGIISETNISAPEFLNGLKTWFSNTSDPTICERIHLKLISISKGHPIERPGYFDRRHYTTYILDVENLINDRNLENAEKLLLNLVEATESENALKGEGVAPWYYEELARIYRKQKIFRKEVDILEDSQNKNMHQV